MIKKVLLYAGVAILGVMAGALYSTYRTQGPSMPESGVELIGQQRPPFTLGATDGRRVSADEFDGRVMLVNFWATWCAPCREEMPMLAELQDQFAEAGLSVVGIALDDVQRAREFLSELGVSYTNLVGGADVMATGIKYGNRAGMLPYSVLVDRDGVVRWTHLGELDRDNLESRIVPLL